MLPRDCDGQFASPADAAEEGARSRGQGAGRRSWTDYAGLDSGQIMGDIINPGLPLVDVAGLVVVQPRAATIEEVDIVAGGGQMRAAAGVPSAMAGDAVQHHDMTGVSLGRAPNSHGETPAVGAFIKLDFWGGCTHECVSKRVMSEKLAAHLSLSF